MCSSLNCCCLLCVYKVREQTIAQLATGLTAAQRLGDQELVQVCCSCVCVFLVFTFSPPSSSHSPACVCDSLGSVSPVTSAQPSLPPLTRPLRAGLCSGAGGQVIIEGAGRLINFICQGITEYCFLISLQHGLRCGVHMELAKVCADKDQLQSALEHINKARYTQ